MEIDYRKRFLSELKRGAEIYGTWEMFDGFLELSALCISNFYDKTQFDRREKQFMKTMGRFKGRENCFPTMLACLIVLLQQQAAMGRLKDILGEIFHELDVQDKWNGQFFSPPGIADMMGALTFDKKTMDAAIKDNGYVSINEPCSGGGSLIYGFINTIEAAGYNKRKHCKVVASDIDIRCVYMTYLQCAFYAIPAIVVQRDIITMKDREYFFTPAYIQRFANEMQNQIA